MLIWDPKETSCPVYIVWTVSWPSCNILEKKRRNNVLGIWVGKVFVEPKIQKINGFGVRHLCEFLHALFESDNTGRILFFSNLAVEEVPNYELLLDHSHFAYVEPLSNHTSSTAKLEKKRIRPVSWTSLNSIALGATSSGQRTTNFTWPDGLAAIHITFDWL